MTTTVTGLFDTYEAAVSAVEALEASGVPHADISLVANNEGDRHTLAKASNAAADAGTGAGIGAVVGGAGGLLAGLGMMAIPGVGPVVAAGWLVATAVGAVGGAAVGGAAGGLVGSLTGAGVPEEDAHLYAEGVRRGGTLVTARVDDARASDARAILQSRLAVDPAGRREVYRAEGWSRFDETASPYDADEAKRERVRNDAL